MPCFRISQSSRRGVLEGEEKTAIVEKYNKALQLKLVRLKCDHVRQLFAELDQDKDGKWAIKDVQELLRTLVEGTGDDWLRCQFRLYDTDGDEIVTESESQKILDSMILTQKAVLAELFATHVDQMPKKHMKLLDIAVNETNWKEKLPEKVRCVFYFAPKEDEEDKTVCWEAFKESQEAELPELNDIVRVYCQGILR
ncbi:hypothetical protein Poli38472_014858 [Pythium oligandrum]|uniref:Calmodulin n=1 Tax=Pythium oligandrum TaxID=41045 RepID=A0A8K1C760_PYTOL|nr:hypothetical protein Poli38472_014858 [Pythium oligandrum]|eukprot:TMW57671.1 hypothetical protein Poli38472_014858 [Pythium oligandrum]